MDDLNTTGIEAPVADIATPEPAPESRRESITRALDETTAAPKEGDATPAERARDEGGRFAPGKGAPKAAAAVRPTLTAKGPAAVTQQAAAQTNAEPEWAKPPKSWANKELQEAWAKGDLDKIRQGVHTREEQMRQGVERIIPKARFADEFTKAIQPYMDGVQRHAGGDPIKAVVALMDAHKRLTSTTGVEQAQVAARFLQSNGIDLRALMGIAQASPEAASQLQSVQAQLATVTAERDALKKTATTAEDEKLYSQIDALSAKPGFDAARPFMKRYLLNGLAETYEEAYELALRLNPSIAPAVTPTAITPATRQQRHNAAQAARAAAVSVRSATPATQTQPKAQDRRTAIAEAFSAREGRL